MKFRNIAALLALSAALTACVSGNDDTKTYDKPTAGFQAQFDPSLGILPFPNDLYSNPKTGQIDIPGDPTVPANGPILALNHLDGYGTQSDIKVYFTAPVDASSLNKSDIIVVKASSDPSSKAVTGVVKQLREDVDYSVSLSPGSDSDGMVVDITPLHPLDPSTVDPITQTPTFSTYLVIVTSGVKAAGGGTAEQSAEFKAIVAADTPAITATGADPTKIAMPKTDPLYPVALFSLGQLAVAAHAKIPLSDVAVTFSFSTQFLKAALTEVAATVSATAQPTGVGVVDTHLTVCDALFKAGKLPDNVAAHCEAAVPGSTVTEVFAGTVALPYYLTVPAKGSTAALTDSWRNAKGGDVLVSPDPTSIVPVATVTQNVIPVLVAMPLACGAAPVSGWPVTIFQHGITRNREDMLAVASSLAVGGAPALCTAVVAIDLPLHGVTDTSDPFYTKGFERTFDMDANGVAGASSGNIAASGTFFINLSSTVTSRDNLREGAADLLNLAATVPNIHPGGANLDGTKVFFVGHSLGAIVGTDFLAASAAGAALNPTLTPVQAAVLAMPGGHITKLLTDSPAFATKINQGLAAQGLATGTQEYYDFLNEAQAVVEDGDPGNYAADAASGIPIHMIEVVGGHDSSSPPDKVVPNSATDVLIAQMGITTPITATSALVAGGPTLAQFTTGDHGSLLDPSVDPDVPGAASASVQAEYAAVTVEMQKEAASVVFGNLAGAPSITVTSNTFLSATLKK